MKALLQHYEVKGTVEIYEELKKRENLRDWLRNTNGYAVFANEPLSSLTRVCGLSYRVLNADDEQYIHRRYSGTFDVRINLDCYEVADKDLPALFNSLRFVFGKHTYRLGNLTFRRIRG